MTLAVVIFTNDNGPFPRSHDAPLLFHLEHDPSEPHDVAHRYPEVVAELIAEAERLQQLGDSRGADGEGRNPGRDRCERWRDRASRSRIGPESPRLMRVQDPFGKLVVKAKGGRPD